MKFRLVKGSVVDSWLRDEENQIKVSSVKPYEDDYKYLVESLGECLNAGMSTVVWAPANQWGNSGGEGIVIFASGGNLHGIKVDDEVIANTVGSHLEKNNVDRNPMYQFFTFRR